MAFSASSLREKRIAAVGSVQVGKPAVLPMKSRSVRCSISQQVALLAPCPLWTVRSDLRGFDGTVPGKVAGFDACS